MKINWSTSGRKLADERRKREKCKMIRNRKKKNKKVVRRMDGSVVKKNNLEVHYITQTISKLLDYFWC